jgi:hypothetical protein
VKCSKKHHHQRRDKQCNVERYIEERWRNHCCSGKATSIQYSGRVRVYSLLSYPACKAHAPYYVIHSLSCCTILFHIISQKARFSGGEEGGKSFYIKCVFWSLQVMSEIFLILRRAERDLIINVVCFLLGNSPGSEFYMPTFRNTLFHLHRRISVEWLCLRNVGVFTEKKGLARKWPEPVGGWQGRGEGWARCVPKRRHIKFRRRGITQKKAYNIQNTVKVWNLEKQFCSNLYLTRAVRRFRGVLISTDKAVLLRGPHKCLYANSQSRKTLYLRIKFTLTLVLCSINRDSLRSSVKGLLKKFGLYRGSSAASTSVRRSPSQLLVFTSSTKRLQISRKIEYWEL